MKKEMKAANIFAKAGQKKLAKHERREAMGKEKDTPAIAKKEMATLKKAKAPKDVMDYEKSEHSAMGMKRGGKVKKYAKGGGVAERGISPTKHYSGEEDYGSEVENDNTDAEGYGTKIERSEPKEDYSSAAFRKAYAAAKAKGENFKWKRPNGQEYTVAVKDAEPAKKESTSSGSKMSSDGPASRKALGVRPRKEPTFGEALGAKYGTAGQRAEAKKEGRGSAFSGRFGTEKMRKDYVSGYAGGGSVMKYSRGDGVASRGKTKANSGKRYV
jgi:hypothetical protein